MNKFEDAIAAGSTCAGVVGEDVVLCDVHARHQMIVTRAGEVKSGDDGPGSAGTMANSGDAGEGGQG